MPVFKITNSQIVAAKQVLDRLAADHQIPAGLRWSAAQAKRSVEGTLKDLGGHELALVREYAELDAAGEFVNAEDPKGNKLPNSWVFKGVTLLRTLDASDTEGRAAASTALEALQEGFRVSQASLMGSENEITAQPRPIGEFEDSNLSGDDLLAVWFLVKDE